MAEAEIREPEAGAVWDLRARWVAALRSGKYQQGSGLLHYLDMNDEHRYCCLGVLCDVVDPLGWESYRGVLPPYQSKGEVKEGFRFHKSDIAVPSPRIMSEAGLVKGGGWQLVLMNDDKRKTFDDIADYLEGKPCSSSSESTSTPATTTQSPP